MASLQKKSLVFIAHDDADKVLALAVKDWIEKIFLNCDAFVSGPDLLGGHTWPEALRENLERAKIIVALMTHNSVTSRWVHLEAGAGICEKKTVPLCVGIEIEAIGVPLKLIQGRAATADGLMKLTADIARLVGVRQPEEMPNLGEVADRFQALITKKDSVSPSEVKPYDKELLTTWRQLSHDTRVRHRTIGAAQ